MVIRKDILSLLRPHQWIKNVFILLPVFFGHKIGDISILPSLLTTVFAFCLTSGAVYIFNDIRDLEQDRKHPSKCNRPLASGRVSLATGRWIIALAGGSGLTLAWFVAGVNVFFVLVGYSFLNLLYSLGLKHIAILDICVIAIGFVLRLYAGEYASGVTLSKWIILMTFLLALFLALAKRRNEMILALQGSYTRSSLDGYNIEFISSSMVLMAGVIIVSYIMYTVSPEVTDYHKTTSLYYTSFWVIIGLLRYLQITFVQNWSGSPTMVLLKDRFIQYTVAGWIVTLWILLYAVQP